MRHKQIILKKMILMRATAFLLTVCLLCCSGCLLPVYNLFSYFIDLADCTALAVENELPEGMEYQQLTALPNGKHSEVITLDGMLPVNAEVTVENQELVSSDAICSYSITITDVAGNDFQPFENNPIKVGITNSMIGNCDQSQLHLWHIDDAGIREEVSDFIVEGETIRFEAEGFSLYEVSSGEPQVCTYEFYTTDNTETYKKYYYITTTGKMICEQIIKQNDTLMVPELPAKVMPDGVGNKTFVGWYILNDSDGNLTLTDQLLDFENHTNFSVGSTVKVGAHYADCAYLIFHDQFNDKLKSWPIVGTRRGILVNGQTEIPTTDIEVNYDDDISNGTKVTHMVFAGWTTEKNVTPGQVSEYKVDDTMVIRQNTELYPLFNEVAWLSFVTGGISTGAKSIQPISYKISDSINSLPIPERTGYIFEGWYADGECQTQKVSDAAGKIVSGSTLPETLEIKNENQTRNLYISGDTRLYAKWSPGQAQYTILIWRQSVYDDVNCADEDKKYDYADSIQLSATTGSTVSVAEQYKNYAGNQYTGFYYARSDSSKTVAANGSTILNVYYDRVKVTYEFYADDNYATKTETDMVGLYNQRLAFYNRVWPTENQVRYYYENAENGTTIMTFLDVFNRIERNRKTDFSYDNNNNIIAVTQKFYKDGTNKSNIYHLREKLDNTYPTSITDENCIKTNGSGNDFNLSDKFIGFTVYGYTKNSINAEAIQTGAKAEKPYNSLYIYHKRNKYELSFLDPTTNAPVSASASILYEDKLSQYKPATDPIPPEGYEFVGWTYDPAGTKPVDWENDIMPANNLAMYAKWEQLWYLVQVDPNGGEFEIQSTGTDNDGYSTWFWVNYDEKVNPMDRVTRNYEEASNGTYYYKYRDRSSYGISDNQYYETESRMTDRSACYTEDISAEGVDLSKKYAYSSSAYRFSGWYKVEEDGTETLYSFDTPVHSDLFLRLHWKALGTYFIEYDPGDGVMDDKDQNEVEFKQLDDSDYADKARVVVTRTVAQAPDGTNFIGWKLRNDPSGQLYYPGGTFEFNSAYAEIVTDNNGNIKKKMILDAVYQAIEEPSIIYCANGGTLTLSADHGDGTFLKNITYHQTTDEYILSDITEEEKYNYNIDSGKLTVSNLVNNTNVTLSSGEGFYFEYNGIRYDFCGWNTKPDGTGTHFDAGSNLYYVDTVSPDPITLYAEWELKIYFDKNNEYANWGGDWSGYEYDSQKNQYYTKIKLNSLLKEPADIPVQSSGEDVQDRVFQYWSPTRYTLLDDNEPFDFTIPVTQERIEEIQASPYLTLYAIWDTPPVIRLHAVDSSQAILVNKDEEWRYQEYFTVNTTEINIDNVNVAYTYADPKKEDADADYKYEAAFVSDSMENISDENAITKIYYNQAAHHVYVTYKNGTDAPLPDDKEIYLVYYTYPSKIPVGYVAMDKNGGLADVSVSQAAPKIANVDSAYAMADNLNSPLGWVTGTTQYHYYSYAIGEKNANSSSKLHIITESSSSDASRPSLIVQDTWRGFKYTVDGVTWKDAGYDIQLYAVYYQTQPTIVNLHERTIGFASDMNKLFEYTVNIEQTAKIVKTRQYYYKSSNSTYVPINSENAEIYRRNYSWYTSVGTVDLSDTKTETDGDTTNILENYKVQLSDGHEESFTLFYDSKEKGSPDYNDFSYGTTSDVYYKIRNNYYKIYYKETETELTSQTIQIVQKNDPDFDTEITQDPTEGTITQNTLTYIYTSPETSTVQDVTYSNTRIPVPVEVHVALVNGKDLYDHDSDSRTHIETNYKQNLAMGDSMILLDTFSAQNLLDRPDKDQYVFAGIIYGDKDSDESTHITVEGNNISTLTFGHISDEPENFYEMYLNEQEQMLLGKNKLYYVYYKKPVITYWYEDGKGRLTQITPLQRNNSDILLNGSTVEQWLPLMVNGTEYHDNSDFVISQTGNYYKVPPDLDYLGETIAVSYERIGVGTGTERKISELLDYSDNKELRLNVQDGIVKYRFSNSDEYSYFTDEAVIYVIYKGGNKLTVQKTINAVDTSAGSPTFQFRIKRVRNSSGVEVNNDQADEYVISLAFSSEGTRSAELSDLPPGYYEITELSHIRYELNGSVIVYPDENSEIQGTTATIKIGSKSEIMVQFNNQLKETDKKTYQTFSDNHIKYSE